jgi:hypothetical protein
MEKPLFIPLKTKWFRAFQSGEKTDELRLAGGRWNARTCREGRPVILSKGYGKSERLAGTVWRFKEQHGSTFGSTYRAAIEETFGTLDVNIAVIGIADLRPV